MWPACHRLLQRGPQLAHSCCKSFSQAGRVWPGGRRQLPASVYQSWVLKCRGGPHVARVGTFFQMRPADYQLVSTLQCWALANDVAGREWPAGAADYQLVSNRAGYKSDLAGRMWPALVHFVRCGPRITSYSTELGTHK